ncbi:MAG: hypothetical protein ABI907_04585 [Ramlibacter sp.]
MQLEEQRIELTAACRRFAYSGGWAVSAIGELVVDGTVETTTATGISSTAATLRLRFSELEPTSPQVTVTLSGEGGAILVGPVVLQRAGASVGAVPPECGKP